MGRWLWMKVGMAPPSTAVETAHGSIDCSNSTLNCSFDVAFQNLTGVVMHARTRKQACRHTRMRAGTQTRRRACRHAHTHTRTHERTHARMRAHTETHGCTHSRVCPACPAGCAHSSVCTRRHTGIHARMQVTTATVGSSGGSRDGKQLKLAGTQPQPTAQKPLV